MNVSFDFAVGDSLFVLLLSFYCGVEIVIFHVVASLMVADVILPTLSRTNFPTPPHNEQKPFKPFNNHIVTSRTQNALILTQNVISIHTQFIQKKKQSKYQMTFHKTIGDKLRQQCSHKLR